jgi:hypothetical protein
MRFSVQRSAFSVAVAICIALSGTTRAMTDPPCPTPCTTECTYFMPERDDQGWTEVPDNHILSSVSPSLVIVYVCSQTGDDSRDGYTQATAVRTMARAWEHVFYRRVPNYKPVNARIRVCRGSVFNEAVGPDETMGEFGGRGPTQPLVVQAWPLAPTNPSVDDRPLFILPTNAAGEMTKNGAVFGAFCCSNADPNNQNVSGQWRGDLWLIGLRVTAQKPDGVNPPLITKPMVYAAQSRGSRLLIEDCYVHDMGALAKIDGSVDSPYTGITIRRNVIARTWQRGIGGGSVDDYITNVKGEALYVSKAEWVLIEDNTLISNGWNRSHSPLSGVGSGHPMIAPKNDRSQGMYVTPSVKHVTIQNNVVIEPAYSGIQSRGNFQRVWNNLILSAGNGIGLGHPMNGDPGQTAANLWRGECAWNVVINGANTDRFIPKYPGNGLSQWIDVEIEGVGQGSGISLSRCRRFDSSGLPWNWVERLPDADTDNNPCVSLTSAVVHHNLVINNEDGKNGAYAGLYINDDRGYDTLAQARAAISSYTAVVTDNVFYNWAGAGAVGSWSIHVSNDSAQQQDIMNDHFVIARNVFAQLDKTRRIGRTRFNPPGGTWAVNGLGNIYATGNECGTERYEVPTNSSGNPTPPFPLAAPYEGPVQDERSWQEATDDASLVEMCNADHQSLFSGEYRGLREYMEFADLAYPAGSQREVEFARAFGSHAETLRRGNWHPELTAANVNAYIRQGFDLSAQPSVTYPITSGCCNP